jgi:hypothetical protein
MLGPREFLEQQCQNLEDCLNDALRHEYGPRESGAFFDECSGRLATLKAVIANLGATPTAAELQEVVGEASRLGALIHRIEHSHVGEFSWAFADELRALAMQLCADTQKPLFFLSSDGPIGSYRIHPEQAEPALVKARVFNIVFPKTLKHHALYHPVLGHEVGHAFLLLPSRKPIEDAVDTAMFSGSPLKSRAQFTAWLATHYPTVTGVSGPALDKIAANWRVELFCDLFGLIVMGPCFPNALLTILSALDPDGVNIGENHPPPKVRFYLQSVAMDELGWSKPPAGTGPFANAVKGTWTDFAGHTTGAVAPSLLTEAQIRAGTRELSAQLANHYPSHFPDAALAPLEELFHQVLARVPPIGRQDFTRSAPAQRVDFRTIIYSGWLAWKHLSTAGGGPSFLDVNRLCEHAVMQQMAVAAQLRGP